MSTFDREFIGYSVDRPSTSIKEGMEGLGIKTTLSPQTYVQNYLMDMNSSANSQTTSPTTIKENGDRNIKVIDQLTKKVDRQIKYCNVIAQRNDLHVAIDQHRPKNILFTDDDPTILCKIEVK